jgi:ketosteroid isomerase-like protein
MKRWILFAAVIATTALAGACAPPAEVVEEAVEEPVAEAAMSPEELMIELAERWDAGMNAADPGAMLALYAGEGSAIMPPDQPVVMGEEAMHTFFEEFFAAGDVTVTDVVESVVADGDLLAGKGSYTVDLTTPDGEIATQSGNWVCVMAKQADGSYLMLRNIWNRDAPLPGMPEPLPIAESGPEAAAEATCYDSPTALDEGFEALVEAGDVAALVAAHAEGASRIPPDMPEMAGRAEIAAYLASRVDAYSERALDLTEIVGMTDGGVGFTHGRFMFDYTPAAGGEHAQGEGKYLAVSQRGDDGCWRLQWVLWNGDAPPAG